MRARSPAAEGSENGKHFSLVGRPVLLSVTESGAEEGHKIVRLLEKRLPESV